MHEDGWNGRLRALTMASPDPAVAARRWASILSGTAVGTVVELGDQTQIAVIEGATTGLVEMQFDVSDQFMSAAHGVGVSVDGDDLVVRDPDGWVARCVRVEDVAPMRLDGATLSHCTLCSVSPMSQCDYWQGVGFRLSETIGDIFGWLRPNPVHHSLAFVAGEELGVHHLAVELPDPASLIRAVDALARDGHRVEFGPGRHIVGGNLFAYVVDDIGIRWELCAELQRLDSEEGLQQHSASMRSKSINLYGPPPPASFINKRGGPGPVDGL